jgi:hypothetical protein
VADRVRVREIDDGKVVACCGSWDVVGRDLAPGADGAAAGAEDAGREDRRGRVRQPGRVRDVIRNFNADGFESLYPKYRDGACAT